MSPFFVQSARSFVPVETGLRHANEGGISALPVDQVERYLPADLIHDDEVVILLLRPSPLYIVLSAFGSLVFIALIAMSLAYISRFSWIAWSDSSAFALGVGLGILRLAWQALEWWSRVYVLTDRRIIRRMGVLRVSVFQTQLKNIEHTSIFALLRERLFGLGSIGFATAGSDTFEAFWVMIARPYAVHKVVVETIERYGRQK